MLELKRHRVLAETAFLMLILCSVAHRAQAAPSAPILIIDLTTDPLSAGDNRVYALQHPSRELAASLTPFYGNSPNPTAEEENALVQQLAKAAPDSQTRWLTHAGMIMRVYLLYREGDQTAAGTISETPRQSQFGKDAAALVKVVAKLAGITLGPELVQKSSLRALTLSHQFQYTRANVIVKAVAIPKGTETTPQGDPIGAVRAETTLTVGPGEHFYISADLPISKTSQLKYNPDTNGFETRDAPSIFYASVSYLVGDLLTTRRDLLENLAFKALLKIDRHPLDSYGLAVGYRIPSIKAYGFELEAVSPFVGHVWTREDAPPAPPSASSEPRRRYRGAWTAGISLNLDKALDWIK